LNKYVILLSVLALILVSAGGCGSLPFAALNNPTETPTRTPRPTFTPKSSATATSGATDTAAPTETPASTDTPQAPDTPTQKAVTPKPPRATQPPAPPQPTKLTFPVYQDFGPPYFCPQDSVNEVIIYIRKAQGSPRPFAGGLYVGAFVPGGDVLKDGAGKPLVRVTDPKESVSYGTNCTKAYDRLHPDWTNGKIDVNDAVRMGTTKMAIRFVRSATDFTPLSQDVIVDFSASGRWWLYFGAQ
jgi:hypothetical protein